MISAWCSGAGFLKRGLKYGLSLALFLLLLFFDVSLVTLPAAAEQAGDTPRPAVNASDPNGLEAWADQQFKPALAEKRFSGAVITVVQGGRVVLSKGYGYADAARGTPVLPDQTRFRIGSTSKIFTATAVAQLLEAGKITSLNDPANKYLKRFQLPKAFGHSITLWDLLTHRAGFEDKAFGLGSATPPRLPVTTADILAAMPKVVREPGTESAYSNFSLAVLGIVVEDVSGEPISQYLAAHIFKPLGMSHSFLNYDFKAPPSLGIPYAYLPDGTPQQIKYVPMNPFIDPAGGVVTTGPDMVRFMEAHLQDRNGLSAILTPRSFTLMHSRHVGNHEAVSGFGMTFIIHHWNGVKVVEHGGGWPGFQTIMMMFPDKDMGVFISIMGGPPIIGLYDELKSLVIPPKTSGQVKAPMNAAYVREDILAHLWGNYHPLTEAGAAAQKLTPYLGTYWRERRVFTTNEAIFGLMNASFDVMRVERSSDHTLRIGGVDGYRPVAQGVFWKPDGGPHPGGDPNASELYGFTVAGGKATAMSPLLSVDIWQRASPYWNSKIIGMTLALVTLIGLTGIFSLFWHKGQGAGRWLKFVPITLPILIISLPLVLLACYADGDGVMYRLLEAQPARFIGLAMLGNLAALVALGMVVGGVAAWRQGYWGAGKRGFCRRLHFTLLALNGLALLPCLYFVNLIGIHLP